MGERISWHPLLAAQEGPTATWSLVDAFDRVSVFGVCFITDTRDGRHYDGKADGEESIRPRWHA